jgi:hypothetical protein
MSRLGTPWWTQPSASTKAKQPSWRPFAWGLLFMVLLAPILGVVGFIAITVARHAR